MHELPRMLKVNSGKHEATSDLVNGENDAAPISLSSLIFDGALKYPFSHQVRA